MRIGRLKWRVVIQTPTYTEGDRGLGETVTWADSKEVWAEIITKDGSEFLEAGQYQSRITHLVRMRYRNDVTHRNRIKWEHKRSGNTRYFDIRSVAILGRNEGLQLLCEEDMET